MNTKAGNIVLWVLQVLAAAMFLYAGSGKLMGNEMAVKSFEAIGFGQWFRYLTGVIEVGSGILLFIPALCGVGALLLVCTMIGAVATHFLILGGDPKPAIILLVVTAVIAFGRRERTMKLIRA